MRGLDCQQTKTKSLQVLFKYKLILRTITGLRYFSLLYAFVVDTTGFLIQLCVQVCEILSGQGQ